MKKNVLICTLVLLSQIIVAQTTTISGSNFQSTLTYSGIELGSVIAIVISWSRNESIVFAILHGILGWFYVLYFAIVRAKSS